MMDSVVYGLIVPAVATYFAGTVTNIFSLDSTIEIFLAVGFTLILFYCVVWYIFDEFHFWKHLLALEDLYSNLLQVSLENNVAYDSRIHI